MESDVLKAVEEISGYTPDEMIAMYNDYERMAKELEAYEDTGLTPEVCAEYRKFEDEVIASGMTFGELVELMYKERTRWIPVDEKQPEGEDCFVYERRTKKVYLAYAEELDTLNREVTHWMPFHLPEAPNEAEKTREKEQNDGK